jgi:ssDNA-binding replication factor A large subunit
MISLPYEEIIRKIKEKNSISDADLNAKIKAKMDQLSGLISKEGAAYIVANDLGVKLVQTVGLIKIKDIVPGQRSVETAGIVTRKFDIRSFETENRKGRVGNFIMADSTGQIRVTVWNDQVDIMDTFKEGDTIKIVNGLVKNNMGQAEVSINDRTKVLVNPSDVKIDGVQVSKSSPQRQSERKKISELKADEFAEVFATVVQVYDPRFFEQCPQCRKKPDMQGGEFVCEQHGKVTPDYGYVTNIVLDDGSDNVRAVMFKEQMQELFGKTDDELKALRATPEKFEDIKNDLLGEQIIVTGKVQKNEMFDRLELRSTKVQRNVDPGKEIEKLKSLPTLDEI